mgnify:CR=1 FL=1
MELLPTKAERDFLQFHKENPKVFEELVALAEKARSKGRKKIGMKMLFEIVRWNRMFDTTDLKFKLNNNYTGRYARMIMETYPQYEGMFELRELRS